MSDMQIRFNDQPDQLNIHDIRVHDLHQWVHAVDTVDPANFHHHHGANGEHDILYHAHDGDNGHRHYLYNPIGSNHYDDYANAHHAHRQEQDGLVGSSGSVSDVLVVETTTEG